MQVFYKLIVLVLLAPLESVEASVNLEKQTEETLDFILQFSAQAAESGEDIDCGTFGKELGLLEEKNFYVKELANGTNYARGLFEKFCYEEAGLHTRKNPHVKAEWENSYNNLLRSAPWEMTYEQRVAALKDSWKADFSDEDEDEITDAIFDKKEIAFARQASCSKTRNNVRCTYQAATGKGLSIVRVGNEFKRKRDTFLVCAQAAYTRDLRLLFKWREGYNITHTCRVSEKNFAKYRNKKIEEIDDEEVAYLFKWATLKKGSPISAPKALDVQCKIGFKDAHYCTPTMVILPTEHSYKKTVCSLETKARSTNLLLARVSSTKSKWECSTYNLLNTYTPRHKENDIDCMEKNCALPYIPEEK